VPYPPAAIRFLKPRPRLRFEVRALFEIERNPAAHVLVAHGPSPCLVEWPAPRSGFASNNNPLKSIEVDISSILEQWLERYPPSDCLAPPEMVEPRKVAAVLDGHAGPDIRRPRPRAGR